MAIHSHHLPPEWTAQLARMIRRVKLILLVRGSLAVAAVAAGAVLTIMGVDAAVVLIHPAARWIFSLLALALTAAAAWSMLLLPLARPLTLTRMARVLETRHPDMQERISSALELSEHGGADAERASAELVALLTRDARTDLAGVAPKREFSVRTVKPFLLAAACVAAVLCLLFALWPGQSWLLFLRALVPYREFDTLAASVLNVKPGDIMQLAKTPLRFEVTAPERHGLRAEIHFLRTGGRTVVERMKRLSAQGVDPVVFELEIPSVEASFEYRVRYGNAYTRPYTVIIRTEPSIAAARVFYTYPAYTGLQATQQVGDAQSITAVAGTRVRIEADFDRPCASALNINALALPNPAGTATNGVWLQALSTNRNGRWSLTLRDAYGFTNCPVWAAYTAVPDRPPEVTLAEPEASRLSIPPYDRLALSGAASDDFGLSAMEWVIRPANGSEQCTPLKASRQGGKQAALEGVPDLQALYARGIRSFRVCFRVTDNLPPELGGPQVSESRAIEVKLEPYARTLRDQVRETVRRDLEKQLRKAAQNLHEAANRVAQEKWSFDRPELSAKAAEKLDLAREAAVSAEEQMAAAARSTEKTPFAMFAKEILDARDEKVEPAFQKLEQIPLTGPDKRRPLGEETERMFREAADKVNDLVNRVLQEENRKQEEQGRLAALGQREAALAQQAKDSQMERREMEEWVNRQNDAEQKLWQSRAQLEEAAFNKVLENVRQARETMQKENAALTQEKNQTLHREKEAAKAAKDAAALAEQAAEQALTAADKAEAVAGTRAAADAVQKAAEKTAAAAEKAENAAHAAQTAAEKRRANEAVADAAERKAVAERAVEAARQASEAAEAAAKSAEQAEKAAASRPQAGREAQAKQAETAAKAQAEIAKEKAETANAHALETARRADEKGMNKAAEAGQLASESAAFTQRAADLAREAAEKSAAAGTMPEEKKDASLKEARGLSEQARQVAAEARDKAAAAVQRAQEEAHAAAREAQTAAARQAPSEAVSEQARKAVRQAQEAVDLARTAVDAAREAGTETQTAPPGEKALAQQMAEASSLAKQAGEWARQSGGRTQRAEAETLDETRGRAETRQAMAEAEAAAQLAREAAAMARQAARQAAADMADLKAASATAAQAARQRADEAGQKAQQASKIAQALASPALRQSAGQSGESAKLTADAAALAQQSVQTAEKASAATDTQARQEAQAGQTKARQALDLAREAQKQADARSAAEALQLEAAEKARRVAEMLANVMEAQTMREADAWARIHGRLGGVARQHLAVGGGAGGGAGGSRVPLNPDWIRFRGAVDSAACDEMLKKTPAEYRGLVKQYFEELSREGQRSEK